MVHRADKTKYFLFIEPDPSQKSAQPVNDDLTASLQAAMQQAVKGTSHYANLRDKGESFQTANDGSYRGMHFAADGQVSDTYDYLLPNGFITNSLCVHYVQYYRQALPKTELNKLRALHEYMKKNPAKKKQEEPKQDKEPPVKEDL